MSGRARRAMSIVGVAVLVAVVGGCSCAYRGVVKPTVKMGLLSPELETLNDATIATYLEADARPSLPTVLAVAKLSGSRYYRGERDESAVALETPVGEEAAGWREMAGREGAGGSGVLVSQVQIVTPLLVSGRPTVQSLREAAALVHAPLLLVYLESDDASDGYNEFAMAYWTIVGLFLVPGQTVGHYTNYQAVLVDTRSGFILSTAEGSARREEQVLVGAVGIAERRTAREARNEALDQLQVNVWAALETLGQPR